MTKLSKKQAWAKYRSMKLGEHYRDVKNIEEQVFVRDEEERNIEDSLMNNNNIVHIEHNGDDEVLTTDRCNGIEHIEEAVSGCCGSPEHPDVSGMCGGCNEMTGWECPLCGEEMNEIVYGIYDIPHEIDIHNTSI